VKKKPASTPPPAKKQKTASASQKKSSSSVSLITEILQTPDPVQASQETLVSSLSSSTENAEPAGVAVTVEDSETVSTNNGGGGSQMEE